MAAAHSKPADFVSAPRTPIGDVGTILGEGTYLSGSSGVRPCVPSCNSITASSSARAARQARDGARLAMADEYRARDWSMHGIGRVKDGIGHGLPPCPCAAARPRAA